jgi:hypothetical protein
VPFPLPPYPQKTLLQVRFDDTNPSKEKDEYVENIMADMKDLGLAWGKTTYTSDYFPQVGGVCGRRGLIKSSLDLRRRRCPPGAHPFRALRITSPCHASASPSPPPLPPPPRCWTWASA